MTDYPNTEAPVVPTFAVVQTPVPHSVFKATAYRQEWRPVEVIDFYRTPANDQRLQKLQDKSLIQEPTT